MKTASPGEARGRRFLSLEVVDEPAALAKKDRALLNELARPVFVLRDDRTLTAANAAAARWLEGRGTAKTRPSVPGVSSSRVEHAIGMWALSKRQAEVFRLVAMGQSNLAISARLGISDRTVEVHVSAILLRARAATRMELVVMASQG